MSKRKSLLFLTSGFGDNLLALPLALELETQTSLTIVTPSGPQTPFFSLCLPSARVISYQKSIPVLLKMLWAGFFTDFWIYPVGSCTRILRLLPLFVGWKKAVGFTSLSSQKTWQAEIGLDCCLAPDMAKKAWKNSLRLLQQVGLTPSRKTWTDYIDLLRPRLPKEKLSAGRLLLHAGSAHYSGQLERYKRWPLERFMKIAVELLQENRFSEVCWLIGPTDTELEPSINNLIERSSFARSMRIVSYASFDSSLIEMGKFISSGAYMLTNDSGLAHLATLYDVPLTALMSGLGQPSYSGQNGPLSQLLIEPTECYGCCVGISAQDAERFQCDFDWVCMGGLTVEKVSHAVKSHWEKLNHAYAAALHE